jgi:DNA-binding LacI/PurR family transcriptional regulator
MDQQISDCRYSSVLSSNYYGMYRSTRELVKAGHKEIGFLGALEDSRNIIDRYYGYKKCMRESGLKINRQWLISDGTAGKTRSEIVLPEELPTAFACCGDFSAGLLYDKLKERGLRVPEDISLASYDDYLQNHELSGKLTSYHVDIEHMAKCAIKLVLREMVDPSAAGMIYEVDSYVVCRSSIAKPRR